LISKYDTPQKAEILVVYFWRPQDNPLIEKERAIPVGPYLKSLNDICHVSGSSILVEEVR
jgi:hypothetical protein